jgi:hypothetical protein
MTRRNGPNPTTLARFLGRLLCRAFGISRFMQSLVDAGLISAERAAALKDENDLPLLPRRLPLGLFLTALHVASTRDVQHVLPIMRSQSRRMLPSRRSRSRAYARSSLTAKVCSKSMVFADPAERSRAIFAEAAKVLTHPPA